MQGFIENRIFTKYSKISVYYYATTFFNQADCRSMKVEVRLTKMLENKPLVEFTGRNQCTGNGINLRFFFRQGYQNKNPCFIVFYQMLTTTHSFSSKIK